MGKIIMIDTSGSMAEEGKKSVVRYLIYAIEGIMKDCYPQVDYGIYLWNEAIAVYGGKMEFSGCTDADVLSQFLENHGADDILLVGDGSYSDEVKKVIRAADNHILALMAGSDCNRAALQKAVGKEKLYESFDVSTCINDFVHIA